MKLLNKILTAFLLLGILLVLIFVAYFVYSNEQEKIFDSINIEFNDKVKIEYGSDALSNEIVDSVVGEIVGDYPYIDTFTVGKQTLTYEVEYKGQTKAIQHTIEIVDTHFPEITLKEDVVTLKNGEEYNPKENVESVFDIIDGDIYEFDVIHSLDVNKAGEYEVKVEALDSNKNKTDVKFTIIVEEKEEIVEKVVPTYINSILLVNKVYHLPSTFGGQNPIATSALKNLQDAAKIEGYELPLLSGYRSYDYQKELFQSYANKYGEEKANTFSAKAGQSEHQTGLAFDVGSIDDSYGETESGKWLLEHCAEYGFIIRYPKGKEHITGYKYEPWHIRYVGVEHATTIMEQEITLEEYLGVN